MIKLIIFSIVGIGAAIAWLRLQWAVDKNKRAASKLVSSLKDGSYTAESFRESLDMNIRVRNLPVAFNQEYSATKIAALSNTHLNEIFHVAHAVLEPAGKGVIIAEGRKKDNLSAGSREVDVTYPCWLYIDIDNAQNTVSFKSSIPDGKDHHHLLEDVSDIIYDRCIKAEAEVV